MISDRELFCQYTERGDDAAFGELVRRHVNMVYSVALRLAAGDTHLAQDVAQIVFTELARNARRLADREVLGGWLHTTARFIAIKAIRTESRRRTREQEASLMHANPATPEPEWEQLRPLLDESVGHLDEGERDAIVLRFFEGKSHREVGDLLGLSENSANKRVERALEKLRAYFAVRGITVSSALLAATMSANSVQAAPAGLVADVTKTSLAGVSGGTLGKTFLLALLMSTKIKIILALVVLLAIGAAFTFDWSAADNSPDVAASSTKPAPAATNQSPKAPAPPTRVVAPVLPTALPLVPSPTETNPDANPPKFVAEPKAELRDAIATGIHFLEAKDLVSGLKTLNSPGLIEYMRQAGYGSTIEEMADEMRRRQPNINSLLAEQFELFRDIQDLTPEISADGKRARYTMPSPGGGKGRVANFFRVNGFWYYGSATEADRNAPP